MATNAAPVEIEVETAAEAVAREDAFIAANEARINDEEFGAAVLQEAHYQHGN